MLRTAAPANFAAKAEIDAGGPVNSRANVRAFNQVRIARDCARRLIKARPGAFLRRIMTGEARCRLVGCFRIGAAISAGAAFPAGRVFLIFEITRQSLIYFLFLYFGGSRRLGFLFAQFGHFVLKAPKRSFGFALPATNGRLDGRR